MILYFLIGVTVEVGTVRATPDPLWLNLLPFKISNCPEATQTWNAVPVDVPDPQPSPTVQTPSGALQSKENIVERRARRRVF